MSAIIATIDGTWIYLALEDASNLPIIGRVQRDDLAVIEAAYEPGAGTVANVAQTGDNKKVVFYGDFGTDVKVILHDADVFSNTDISPSSLGAAIVNTCVVDPGNIDRIAITVDTNEDLMYTEDGGTTWDTWDAALGFDATALDILWSGLYDTHRYFVAGDNGADLDILYSPNQGSSDSNQEDATLGAKTNITNLKVVKG